jgi:hypothetical protein
MKSTEQIHEIIDRAGVDNKPQLMKMLKALRIQVADETKKQLLKEFHITAGAIRRNFNSLIKHYENGT